MTIGNRGPVLLEDYHLMEKLAQFHRCHLLPLYLTPLPCDGGVAWLTCRAWVPYAAPSDIAPHTWRPFHRLGVVQQAI